MNILQEAKDSLTDYALEKLISSLNKNPDPNKFTDKDNSISFLINTKYAPLTSVDVERSFNVLKNIYTQKRTRLSDENLEKLCNLKHFMNFSVDNIRNTCKFLNFFKVPNRSRIDPEFAHFRVPFLRSLEITNIGDVLTFLM